MIKAQTLKGFRDFLPKDALLRERVIQTCKTIFSLYGFDPLETPALEYAETLLGKYGNEADKLLYLFKDNGGRDVGLRYDQTVPFARVIAQYKNELPMPWKRYQVQPVWRAENTQKGRYREFLQCDIDIVGEQSMRADCEIISTAITIAKTVSIHGACMKINDRRIFETLGLTKADIIAIDKLDKIGDAGVIEELEKNGATNGKAVLNSVKFCPPTSWIKDIFAALTTMGLKEEIDFKFDPCLARGLDYYTSTIFEMTVPGVSYSIAGGGRYDNLIGSFNGSDIPAVGIAFGFDRIIDWMKTQKIHEATTKTTVFVTIFDEQTEKENSRLTTTLRESGIATDEWMGINSKLEKQLKYANKKGIPFVIIQGPDEIAKNVVQLKNMVTHESTTETIESAIQKLQSSLTTSY